MLYRSSFRNPHVWNCLQTYLCQLIQKVAASRNVSCMCIYYEHHFHKNRLANLFNIIYRENSLRWLSSGIFINTVSFVEVSIPVGCFQRMVTAKVGKKGWPQLRKEEPSLQNTDVYEQRFFWGEITHLFACCSVWTWNISSWATAEFIPTSSIQSACSLQKKS
jgi:hypothetical protein